jgi:uncharacterized membrane protein
MPDKIKSPERLVFFSDAVVAIALTLLVLPLADAVRTDKAPNGGMLPVGTLLSNNEPLILSFLLSFVVIVRFWIGHHRVFEQVKAYSMTLMWLNMAWVLTIVILPFPTELVAAYPSHDRIVLVFYIGTLFVSSLLLTALLWVVRNDPEVARAEHVISDRWWFDSITSTLFFALALTLVAAFPQLSYYPLLVNMLQPQLVRMRFRGNAHKREIRN